MIVKLVRTRNPGPPTLGARPDLPHDLTKLTAELVEWCVAYHVALPLAEIRRRQDLTDRQIGMAWQQRNDFALNNLRVREEVDTRRDFLPGCVLPRGQRASIWGAGDRCAKEHRHPKRRHP